MQVGILGPLEVRAGGAAVAVGGVRVRTLLARLVLDAGKAVPAAALSDAVWPARAAPGTRHALHSLMTRLRAALPAADAVRSVPGGYVLDVPPDAVDAVRFERLAGAGRAALQDGRPDAAGAQLRAALGLWRGDALADLPDAPFALAAVARLDELRLIAQEDRIQADLLAGADPAGLVADLYALTAAHPDRERAQALLLRALQTDGRTAEALDHYARLRSSIADRLGTDPSPELRAAHLDLLRSEHSRAGRRTGNLRAPLTSFVGRRRERALLADRLATGRLVTLTGPGGAGKTRLATTVAADLPGRTWLVELAGLTGPDEVGPCVLDTVLGTGGGRTGGTVDQLVAALGAAPALLVLDNAEHLLDPVAALAEDLLGRCPALRVLVTSREPLGIPGEALVPVPPLPVAAPTAADEELRSCAAVRLFADRAAAVRPGFAVTTQNAPAVADICRYLDGLPLAIELAAARVRTVPVEHLATVLGDRFAALTSGSRTALPRHRTLAAVVDWSWDLLTGAERALIEALSVFPGTITPAAAARVGPPDSSATLDALAEKSLLQPVGGPGVRYRMLETIREYAARRLGERTEAARAAHARHFLGLAEAAVPELRGPGQLRRLPVLFTERDNLLGALRFAVACGDAATAVRLASALSLPLTMHGDHAGAARLLRTALDLPGAAAHTPAVAGYLFNALMAGDAPTDLGRFRPAARTAHPAAYAIEPLLAALSGTPVAAPLPTAPPVNTTAWGRAVFWLLRAMLRDHGGDLSVALRDLETAAEQFRAVGERWGLATSLTHLGIVRALLGDPQGAIDALRRAVVPASELGCGEHQRIRLAVAHSYADDQVTARAVLHGVLAADPPAHHVAAARLRLGDLERWAGDLAAADREYGHSARAATSGGEPGRSFRAGLATSRAHAAIAGGDVPGALAHLREARAAASGGFGLATVAVAVAALRAAQGRYAAAATVLGAAHRLRGASDARNPDVAALTALLRSAPAPASYEDGRALAREAAVDLLDAEIEAAAR